MQLTLAAAAAALIATASATSIQTFNNKKINASVPIAQVVNRCSYPVNIWSIDKELGCSAGDRLVLETGGVYQENLRNGTNDGGISIKLSKYEQCGGNDLTQLEYKLNWEEGYVGNYLDVSFVDCTSGDCPGWDDGFYFKSGNNKEGKYKSEVNNEHCPIFNVANAVEAALVSYVKWDDRQTKFCDEKASMALYLCGSEAPDEEDSTPYTPDTPDTPVPSSTEEAAPSETEPSTEAPAYTAPAYTPEANVVAAAAAAVTTPAPQGPPVVKTQVVYETVYVKRHEHAHARRHQHFHA